MRKADALFCVAAVFALAKVPSLHCGMEEVVHRAVPQLQKADLPSGSNAPEALVAPVMAADGVDEAPRPAAGDDHCRKAWPNSGASKQSSWQKRVKGEWNLFFLTRAP